MEFSAKSRQKQLDGLPPKYDLLIIGGGITGAGAAMAAARAGMKTALIDKSDFSSGTSSRSSKMIHGGLRYLQQMNFGLVKESLQERELLLKLLPNQVMAKEYVYPVYEYSKNSRFEVKLGMIGYDLLAGSKRIGHHHQWSVEDFQQKEPAIDRKDLAGGFVYHDCLVDDSRLTLAAIQSAAALGVNCFSYLELTSMQKSDGKWQLCCTDLMDSLNKEYTLAATTVINATGPWTDVIRSMAGFTKSVLRPTKGIHLVFRRERLPLQRSVVIFGEDGRMIFTVPKGEYTYLGTTDTDHKGSSDNIFPDEEDVLYLLKAANHAFDVRELKKEDLISAWAGLRPLIGAEGDPGDISRDFEIIADTGDFLSIAGGKLTTFRVMGIKVIRELLKKNSFSHARKPADEDGADEPLFGGNILNFDLYLKENIPVFTGLWGLKKTTLDRLIRLYGTQFHLIFSAAKGRCHYLGESDILREEILYQIRHEMALTLEDILWRRLSLLLFEDGNGLDIADDIAEIMAEELNWKEERKIEELQRYRQTVALSYGAASLESKY